MRRLPTRRLCSASSKREYAAVLRAPQDARARLELATLQSRVRLSSPALYQLDVAERLGAAGSDQAAAIAATRWVIYKQDRREQDAAKRGREAPDDRPRPLQVTPGDRSEGHHDRTCGQPPSECDRLGDTAHRDARSADDDCRDGQERLGAAGQRREGGGVRRWRHVHRRRAAARHRWRHECGGDLQGRMALSAVCAGLPDSALR